MKDDKIFNMIIMIHVKYVYYEMIKILNLIHNHYF